TLEKLGDKERDAAVDQLAAYLADPAPFTVFVLEATKLDERMKLFKTLTQKALVVSVDLGDSPEQRIPAATLLVPQMATDVGVSIDREAATDLADLLDGDLSRIRSELQKLAAYVSDRKRITPDDVDALVISSKKYTVWQLAEMLAERRRPSALAFLDSLLREGEPPPAIVGALAWMYRKLIEAQELSPRTSPGQAAGMLRMRASAAAVALEQSRKIPRRQLLDGLVALYEADSRLKSGVADQRAVLEFLLAHLMSPSPA
ncbi:MAG: polymerase subunit delta, partial [candidate division NC10 bacterium]|nr:polymerase subunit delta [candidate division NC10 bacterium]